MEFSTRSSIKDIMNKWQRCQKWPINFRMTTTHCTENACFCKSFLAAVTSCLQNFRSMVLLGIKPTTKLTICLFFVAFTAPQLSLIIPNEKDSTRTSYWMSALGTQWPSWAQMWPHKNQPIPNTELRAPNTEHRAPSIKQRIIKSKQCTENRK